MNTTINKPMYFSTTNGKISGQASYYYDNQNVAINIADKQTRRAINLGIKARYTIGEINSDDVDPKQCRYGSTSIF